ncbi:MAG: FtsX-like permease family protein [Kiritimatiellia bacterium]|jgi:hypothetical protein
MLTLNLVLRTLSREKVRAATAVLGVAAAVALLGWHVVLATTAQSQADEAVARATAPYSAWVVGPAAGPRRGAAPQAQQGEGGVRASADATVGFRRRPAVAGALPASLRSALAAATNVLEAVFVTVQTAPLDIRPGGRVLQGPPLVGALAEMPAAGRPLLESHVLERGRWPDPVAAASEAAFNAALFEERHVPVPELGSELPVLLQNGTVTLRIVGLYRADTLVKAFPSCYTTAGAMAAMARLNPRGPQGPTLALCAPAAGRGLDALETLLASVPEAGGCTFTTREAVADRFRSDTTANLMRQLPLSLSLAFITAAFMLVAVLTMGIAEHRRRIAMLRCVGMTRGGAAALMLGETAALAVSGWALGLLAATALVQVFLLAEGSAELPRVVHLDWRAVVSTGGLALATALAAAVAPILRTAKIAPLEVTQGAPSEVRRVSASRTLPGLALMLPIVLLALPFDITPKRRLALMVAVGLPAFVAGSALCLHALMRGVEAVFLAPLGWILRLDPRLLSRRLSRAPGRAGGTVMTLALGLGTFIAIHIWGGSLMSSYVPSPEWPDVIVSVLPNGLDAEAFAAAAAAPGVAPPALPIEASQFPLAPSTVEAARQAGLPPLKSDLVLVFGVDPERAFGGASPLARFRFVEGAPAEAAARLRAGDACLVPEMLLRLTGLRFGDAIGVGDRMLKIVGVLDLNWHLVTSRANVRSRAGRLDGARTESTANMQATVGMVFTSEAVARSMTGNPDTIYFFWLNLAPDLAALHPLQATVRLDASLTGAIDAANAKRSRPLTRGVNALKVHHRDEIAEGTLAHGNEILGTMARVPFWSLLITSMGIAALLVASAKASRREIDVMRAIGLTRGQLARLFLGEALLAALSAIVVSLVAGLLIGWSFTAVTRAQLAAGLANVLVVPWRLVGRGVLFAVAMTLAMAVLPLRRIAL